MATRADIVSNARHAPERLGSVKRLAVWGVVAGLLAAGVWFLFLRGGQPPRSIQLPKPGEITSQAAAPEAAAGKGKAEKAPVETFKVFAPKDPFDPLVETKSAPFADGLKGKIPGPNEGPATAFGGHSVDLVEIVDTSSIRVTVDGTEYSVGLGETFADTFKVVSISPTCAALLYGDEQFTLC